MIIILHSTFVLELVTQIKKGFKVFEKEEVET